MGYSGYLKAKTTIPQETIKPDTTGTAEFFVPGYFIYDGLLMWNSFIADTKTIEEGGRIDYNFADKLSDLQTLREALAITGWSSGTAQPRLEQLDKFIAELKGQQRIDTVPSPAFFSEFVNLSPPPQTPNSYWLGQQTSLSTPSFPAPYSDYSYSMPSSSMMPQSAITEEVGHIVAAPEESVQRQMVQDMQGQSSNIQSINFDGPAIDDMPTSQDIEQFLKSVNYQLYH